MSDDRSTPPSLERILVPVDFSERSRAALERAMWFAEQFGGRVEILHVIVPPDFVPLDTAVAETGKSSPPKTLLDLARGEARNKLDALVSEVSARCRVPLTTRIVTGHPRHVITSVAKEHDLIVMGTHGRGVLGHALLGSIAEQVIRTSPRPVITVKADAARAGR